MKRTAFIIVLVALFTTIPAFAGKGHKCTKPVQTCLNDMVAKLKSTGFIGVELDDEKKHGGKLVVTKVIEGSPAESAGIRAGDELFALNGIRFNEKNHKALKKVKVPGKTVTCTIKRNGVDKEFKIKLVPMPADMLAKYIGEHMMEHSQAATKVAKK